MPEAPPQRPVLREQIGQQPGAPPHMHELPTDHIAPIAPALQDEEREVVELSKNNPGELVPPVLSKMAEDAGSDVDDSDSSTRPLPTDVPPTPNRPDSAVPNYADIEQIDTASLGSYPPYAPGKPATVQPGIRMQWGQRITFSGKRAYIVVGLLVLLLLVGVSVWAIVLQPFTVPAVTAPQQSFRNAQLGIALQYPSGWSATIDRAGTTVHFADSTHTAQVTITVASARGANVLQYIVKQAVLLGMTGTKTGLPLSFAGATWQQVEGSVQQKGARYTETLLVTVHGSRLFTLTQLAPQSTYAQEERLVFSSMRSSLHFL
jgi:hypothetical protein